MDWDELEIRPRPRGPRRRNRRVRRRDSLLDDQLRHALYVKASSPLFDLLDREPMTVSSEEAAGMMKSSLAEARAAMSRAVADGLARGPASMEELQKYDTCKRPVPHLVDGVRVVWNGTAWVEIPLTDYWAISQGRYGKEGKKARDAIRRSLTAKRHVFPVRWEVDAGAMRLYGKESGYDQLRGDVMQPRKNPVCKECGHEIKRKIVNGRSRLHHSRRECGGNIVLDVMRQ